MQKQVKVFDHEKFGPIRTMTNEKGETFFVGKDVAMALGYSNTRDAMFRHVDEEDKTTVVIPDTGSNYKSRAVFINESGPFEVSGERGIISFTHVIYFVIYYPSYVSVLSKKVLVILCHQNESIYEQDYNFFIDHHPVGSPPF